MVKRFDTYEEFIAYTDKARDSYGHKTKAHSHSWDNGLNFNQSIAAARQGDESYVAEANKILDKLEEVCEGSPARIWHSAPFGAYPVIPEYLSGSPTPMRAQGDVGDISPVSVYVGVTMSAGINSTLCLKRGAAVLALVLQLQKIRPVDLFFLSETHGVTDGNLFLVIPCDSKPLSVAHAAFALCHPAFTRRLTYTVAGDVDQFTHGGNNGGWPNDYPFRAFSESSVDKYTGILRRELNLTENDLYIRATYLEDPLIVDPVKWINSQIERYNGIGESN